MCILWPTKEVLEVLAELIGEREEHFILVIERFLEEWHKVFPRTRWAERERDGR